MLLLQIEAGFTNASTTGNGPPGLGIPIRAYDRVSGPAILPLRAERGNSLQFLDHSKVHVAEELPYRVRATVGESTGNMNFWHLSVFG